MSRSFEELVEAKFRREAASGTRQFVLAYGVAFVMCSVGVAFLDSATRATTGVWFFGGATLLALAGLWAGVDASLNFVEANRLKFVREAHEEIAAAEAKRAEEARQGQE